MTPQEHAYTGALLAAAVMHPNGDAVGANSETAVVMALVSIAHSLAALTWCAAASSINVSVVTE
jgi:hypothetical protein